MIPPRFGGHDAFVVMPNHLHFIFFLVGAGLALPARQTTQEEGGASPTPTLSAVVGTFESLSAIKVNRPLERTGRLLWTEFGGR